MKPTDAELEIAIIAAERLCETGTDQHHLAQCLLYLYQRLDSLEQVLTAAEDYLRHDREPARHAVLVNAIETARRAEAREAPGPV